MKLTASESASLSGKPTTVKNPNNCNTKGELLEEHIYDILARAKNKEKYIDIAGDYGVSESTISRKIREWRAQNILEWDPIEGTDYLRAVGKRNVYFIEDAAWFYLSVIKIGEFLHLDRPDAYRTIEDAKKAADEMESLK